MRLYDKTISNMEEVAARGGQIVLISEEGTPSTNGLFDKILIPSTNGFINPILYSIPVQLLAYHAAVFMGTGCGSTEKSGKISNGGISKLRLLYLAICRNSAYLMTVALLRIFTKLTLLI